MIIPGTNQVIRQVLLRHPVIGEIVRVEIVLALLLHLGTIIVDILQAAREALSPALLNICHSGIDGHIGSVGLGGCGQQHSGLRQWVKFGVGQSTYMTDKSRAAAEALVEPYLPEASRREGLPLIFYMFTDMKTQSTDLMFYGHNAEEIIRDAFHVEPEGDIAKLPGVVSRKKQLIPPLLAALQARQ